MQNITKFSPRGVFLSLQAWIERHRRLHFICNVLTYIGAVLLLILVYGFLFYWMGLMCGNLSVCFG